MASIGFYPNNLAYTYNDAVVSLIVGTFVYGLLAIYLDQVMPNEFGSHRHPLFFLKCLKSRQNVAD